MRKTDANKHTKTYHYDSEGRLQAVITEASGEETVETSYTYDAVGNLLTQTDGKGNVTSYTYNVANLVATKTEGSGDTAVTQYYAYNGDGTVATMKDFAGVAKSYEYDAAGNLVKETATNGDEAVTFTYVYDELNRLTSFTDESGTTTYTYDEIGRVKEKSAPGFETVTYGYDMTANCGEGCHYETISDETGLTRNWYDRANRLVKVETADSVAVIAYYKDGARKSITYGDGTVESYTYDGNHNVTSVTNTLADGTVQDKFLYYYDAVGNLELKTETSAGVERGTTDYAYDAQNRLSMVEYPDGSKVYYVYDKAGNREKMTEVYEVTTEAGLTQTMAVQILYEYNDRNQLVSTTESMAGVLLSKTEYTYDANGNQLMETKTEYGADGEVAAKTTVLANSYDLHNQLVRSETEDAVINNTYNAFGYRVIKAVDDNGDITETHFLYDGDNVIMEADADGEVTAKNAYGGPLLFRSVFGENEETYEYLYNAHGDVVTLLSGSAVTATYVYDAFGNITEQTGEADNSILYAGYQYDEETGLYYLNARMYEPVTARFLQADTYLGNVNDPLSLNLYTYCLNNPQKYIDPSGHFAIELATILVTAVVLGMTIDIAIQKFVEQKVCIDLDRTITEGLFSGLIGLITFGGGLAVNTVGRTAAGGIKAVGTVRTIASALISSAVFGATTEAAQDMAHQYFIEGKSFAQIDYRRVGISAALGAVISTGSTMVGAGINHLRAVRTGAHTTQLVGDVMDGQGTVIKNLNGVTYEGPLYRNVGTMPDGTPVNPLEISDFTNRQNYRYTQNGRNGLYFASSQHVMEGEMGAYGSNPYADNRTTYRYENVVLNNMLDLTNPKTRYELDVNLSDLISSDYKNYTTTAVSPAVTHSMGNFAANNGYRGLIVPSARADGGVNIVIFEPHGIDFGVYTTIHDK